MEGGNTFYLLQQIQLSKSASVIRELVTRGKIYIGSSAGSIVAGPDIYPVYRLDKAKEAPKLKGYKGLGLVNFVIMPHWGRDNHKHLYLNQRLDHAYNEKNTLLLLADNQYVMVAKDGTHRIVDIKKNT